MEDRMENSKQNEGKNMDISLLIPFLNENRTEIKINLASGNTVKGINKLEPCFEYSKGLFKEWQERQDQNYFNRKYILSLIYIDKNEYLFSGIYEKISVKEETEGERIGKFTYETKLLNNVSQELIGKLIVLFRKDFRQPYLNYEAHSNDLIILEIRKQAYNFNTFPNYYNVNINFDLLKDIINSNENNWKTALSLVKGVYLINDKSNGKLYVGSASGENAFWQRWTNYIENGHGGNKKLKELIDNNGYNYSSNFIFSILATFPLDTRDEDIISRENQWKERLLTREYGYNDN
jgi:hypothetical protein